MIRVCRAFGGGSRAKGSHCERDTRDTVVDEVGKKSRIRSRRGGVKEEKGGRERRRRRS